MENTAANRIAREKKESPVRIEEEEEEGREGREPIPVDRTALIPTVRTPMDPDGIGS